MHFLTSIALLASAVTATPLIPRAGAPQAPPQTFHLKTTNASQSAHNNLYVYGYHTGAGLNDAVLSSDASKASPAHLNGTTVQFDLGSELPWGLQMVGATDYGSWEDVHINAGAGTKGFSVDQGNLKWSEKNGFGGWLVCDWSHNAPQLFYLYEPLLASAKIPSSCSKADLQTESILK